MFLKDKPLQSLKAGNPKFDCEGRVVGLNLKTFVFGVYFPNGGMGDDRVAIRNFMTLLKFCEESRATGKAIVCGDYNTAHQPVDLARPKDNQNTSGLPIERE